MRRWRSSYVIRFSLRLWRTRRTAVVTNVHNSRPEFIGRRLKRSLPLRLACVHLLGLRCVMGVDKVASLDWLVDTNVTDVLPLLELAKLTELNLSGSEVTNLSALKGLTELTKLDLSGARVTDVSPLMELHQLRIVR